MSETASAESLDDLLARLRACRICEDLPLGPKPILQAGAQARILIVGHAPGWKAHERGRPFDDQSGARLRAWLGIGPEVFYDRDKIALAPMGFCYPGTGPSGDLPPRPICAPTWRPPLLAKLPNIRLTLPLGLFAQRWTLGPRHKGGVAANVEAWAEFWPKIMPLPHPSGRNNGWLARRPWVEGEMIPRLQAQVRALLQEERSNSSK